MYILDNISVVRNALLLFPTRHLYDGRIYWYTVLNHEGTGIVRREGSVCEEIYFLKWVLGFINLELARTLAKAQCNMFKT